jgi:hypothetical protein
MRLFIACHSEPFYEGVEQLFYNEDEDVASEVFTIELDSSATMKMLYAAVRQHEGLPAIWQNLAFKGREISRSALHCRLSEFGITQDCTIRFSEAIRGGGGIPCVDFFNVEQTEALVKGQFTPSAPEWRKLAPGIGIEGVCIGNSICKARGKKVIYNCGFESFDLIRAMPECPACGCYFYAERPLFSFCAWRIDARKPGGTRVTIPWRKVESDYQTYDETKAGRATFVKLVIQAVPLDQFSRVSRRDDWD